MSEQNYYEILGLKKSCSRKEIKKKYRILALKHHPDKGGDEKLFELITSAYNTLVNNETRKKYDNRKITNDHFSLKNGLKEYINTESLQNENKKECENFLKFKDLDTNIPTKLDQNELSKRITELELAREQDDIENTQEMLFNSDNFDDKVFNANFIISNVNEKEIILKKHPIQHNNKNYEITKENVTGFDLNDKLTEYDDPNKQYKVAKNASKKKIDKIKNDLDIYSHNEIDSNYNKELEKLIRNRETETLYLNNMNDFNKNDKSYIISKKE